MLITKPDFYDSFKCRAGECTDSCCIGWEIDIDDETMRKYENENDSLSVKLNRFTDREKQCFILTEDDRCPFLKSDGLCELILTKGEDMLHRHIVPKNRDFQWHQLDVFAELDRSTQIQTALEQYLQLGSVIVTNGGSRFREGLPAANICNLVHKAPTFVVVSLDRERSGPAPGPCQRHWLPHRSKIPHCFPAGHSQWYLDIGVGHFPKLVYQMYTRFRPESIHPNIL